MVLSLFLAAFTLLALSSAPAWATALVGGLLAAGTVAQLVRWGAL